MKELRPPSSGTSEIRLHAYHPQVALRLICWFPPDTGTVAVALFAGDKVRIGDVFYNGVGARADALIDQWKRETPFEEKP